MREVPSVEYYMLLTDRWLQAGQHVAYRCHMADSRLEGTCHRRNIDGDIRIC